MSETTDETVCAFPVDTYKQWPTQQGLTMRDYFAVQALSGTDLNGFGSYGYGSVPKRNIYRHRSRC